MPNDINTKGLASGAGRFAIALANQASASVAPAPRRTGATGKPCVTL
jgi:hypothetical protein